MRIVLVGLIGLFLSHLASATTFAEVTVSELYEESEIVIYAKIESGNILKNDCGVEYAARISETFKSGLKSGELVWFQGLGPTQIGEQYVLFLSPVQKEFRSIASTNSRDMKTRSDYLARCGDSRPKYVVNLFGNGALKFISTSNADVRHAVIIDNVVVVPPENLKVTKLGTYQRYDNDRNDTALDADEFLKYMRGLANRH